MERSFITAPLLMTTLALGLFGASAAITPAVSAPLDRPVLSVSAPTDTEVSRIGDWYEAHIPPRFRVRQSVDVNLLTGDEMHLYLASGQQDGNSNDSSDDGDIDGVFSDDPPVITLRVPSSGHADPLTFAHEYGHYVWFDEMTDGERSRYQVIYDRQRALHHLVTDYASTCVEEGFAEAFSYYTGRPAVLEKRDPLSYQFLVALDSQ